MFRLLVAGGGTGGHLFPGMAVAEALGEMGPVEVRFVGTSRGIETTAVPKRGWHLYLLPVSGLYRVGLAKRLLGLARLPVALIKAAQILREYKPDLVLGVGGYASGPMLLAALALGYKTALQEQNAYPGMTNRLLGRFVPISFVPFEGLGEVFKNPVVVGNPLRDAIAQLNGQPDQRPRTPLVVAIVGGSQGAKVLNDTLIEALPLLERFYDQIEWVHQTGKADYERVMEAYQAYPCIKAQVSPFIEDMAHLYSRAHLFISRAGSMVGEYCAVGRASILVPIAQSSGDHQLKNALALESVGAAICIQQVDLTAEKLVSHLGEFLADPRLISTMEAAALSLYKGNAANAIAQRVVEFFALEVS